MNTLCLYSHLSRLTVAFLMLLAGPVRADQGSVCLDFDVKFECYALFADGRVACLVRSDAGQATVAIPSSASMWYVTLVAGEGAELERAVQELNRRQIPGLLLRGPWAERELHHVRLAKRLRFLDLSGLGVTDEHMPELAGLPLLEHLSIGSTRITDVGLEALTALKRLRSLDVSDCAIRGHSLDGMSSSLERLDLRDNGDISDRTLENISTRLKSLESLALSGCPVSDAGVALLRSLPNLHVLRLAHCPVTDSLAILVPEFRALREIELDYTSVGDGFLAAVGQSSLVTVSLRACAGISDSGLEALSKSRRIERLDLGGCNGISDRGVAQLANIRTLQWVRLPASRFSGVSSAAVDGLRSELPGCLVVQAEH